MIYGQDVNPAIITPVPDPAKKAESLPGLKSQQDVEKYLEKVDEVEEFQEWDYASEEQKRL